MANRDLVPYRDIPPLPTLDRPKTRGTREAGVMAGRHEGEPDLNLRLFSSRWTLLIGAAIGALAAGAVWAIIGAVAQSDPAPSGSQTISHDSGPGAVTAADQAAGPRAALSGCQARYRAQQAPLDAAAASLAQWRVHISAMNKLVAGKISWAQANTFWNQTRKGARHHLASYDAARQSLDRNGPGTCPRRMVQARWPGVRACARAVAARDHELQAADVALRTWSKHVHDMEMLRMGMMSPTTAGQMWMHSWKLGDRELKAYRTAHRASAAQHCGSA